MSEQNEEAKPGAGAAATSDTAALAIDLAMEDDRARIESGGDGR